MADKRTGRSHREKINANNLKAQRLQPCGRCGMRIDYDADTSDPNAFNAGHIKSRVDYPELREDPNNLRPEHQRCNKSAGAKQQLDLGANSRQW